MSRLPSDGSKLYRALAKRAQADFYARNGIDTQQISELLAGIGPFAGRLPCRPTSYSSSGNKPKNGTARRPSLPKMHKFTVTRAPRSCKQLPSSQARTANSPSKASEPGADPVREIKRIARFLSAFMIKT
jgi:hypothetical protein